MRNLFAFALMFAIGLSAVAVATARADDKEQPQAGQEMKLPPGWTQEDMQAMMKAATPGENHQFLAKAVGSWTGTCTHWTAPDAEPVKSQCTATVSAIMDGRFTKWDFSGDMPGMGRYNGFGIQGFENFTGKFVATWLDNFGTGFMNGEGERSSDGRTITWKYTFNCPVAKKPITMRQIETVTGPDTRSLTMFGPNPKTGQEFKMMTIELTRNTREAQAK
jgi:hypothetical protein